MLAGALLAFMAAMPSAVAGLGRASWVGRPLAFLADAFPLPRPFCCALAVVVDVVLLLAAMLTDRCAFRDVKVKTTVKVKVKTLQHERSGI